MNIAFGDVDEGHTIGNVNTFPSWVSGWPIRPILPDRDSPVDKTSGLEGNDA
jgi:hypothetical protein